MSKVIGLMNAAKTKLGAASNYQLAKLSGIPEPDISKLYKGQIRPSEEALARLALILDKPIGEVLAEVRSEDAKTEKSREFWRSFLSATRALTLIALPAIWCVFWWPESANGGDVKTLNERLCLTRLRRLTNRLICALRLAREPTRASRDETGSLRTTAVRPQRAYLRTDFTESLQPFALSDS